MSLIQRNKSDDENGHNRRPESLTTPPKFLTKSHIDSSQKNTNIPHRQTINNLISFETVRGKNSGEKINAQGCEKWGKNHRRAIFETG